MTILGALLFLSPGLRAVDLDTAEAGSGFKHPQIGGKILDRNEMREAIDETQALMDGLARETPALGKKERNFLFDSLKKEFGLKSYVGKMRKAVEQAEDVIMLQNAIKQQQQKLKELSVSEAPPEESRLLGMQTELVGAVEGLRDTLHEVHRRTNEGETRDLRNWIMISAGTLRRAREDREARAAVQVPAPNENLSAEGLSPTADAETVPAVEAPPKARP